MEQQFRDGSYDVIIDKGTIDSMLVAGEQGKVDVLCMLNEVFRVLRAEGKVS